jgi:hypothetical protein
MLRKPRNARTSRLTDWKFFVQIYFVRDRVGMLHAPLTPMRIVYGFDDVALRHVDVVPVYEATRTRIPRCYPRIRQVV